MKSGFVLVILIAVCVFAYQQSEINKLTRSQKDTDAMARATQQADADRKSKLKVAIDAARMSLDYCRAAEEMEYNDHLHTAGTPVSGKKGTYNVSNAVARSLEDEKQHANADCQREYENEIQAARMLQ
jgi:hypothetical protein